MKLVDAATTNKIYIRLKQETVEGGLPVLEKFLCHRLNEEDSKIVLHWAGHYANVEKELCQN